MRIFPIIPLILLLATAPTLYTQAGGAGGTAAPVRGGAAAPPSTADDEIALQRALDQRLSLTLPSVPLSDAFQQIATTAKIPLQVDPACYTLLPYGPTTRVSVDFKDSRLREALDEVLIPLGLQKTVVGNKVMIRPSAPLLRIGRRAEWEELRLLKQLWDSTDLKAPATGTFSLADAIRASLADERKGLIVSLGTELSPAQERAAEQVARQLPMSAYRALELYCQLSNQVWFVEAGTLAGGTTGGAIRIMTQRQWINRQLDRPIQLARNNEPLKVVVEDLTNVSGIRFVPEPGLYQVVPVVNLRSDNGTVRQTLEALAGATRIAFEIREDSILLQLAPGPGNPPRNDTIIGRVNVPLGEAGMFMDLYLREYDVTPEILDMLKRQKQNAIDNMLRNYMTPKTTTQPATAPATTTAAPSADGGDK